MKKKAVLNMNNILSFGDYLSESKSVFLMDKDTKERLLKLDEKYHRLIERYRTKYVAKTVNNIKDEFRKFMDARKMGQKYYPQLDIDGSEVDMGIYDGLKKLREDFTDIYDDCYVARFYIEKIDSMISGLDLRISLEDGSYEPVGNPVDKDLYRDALKVMEENPYSPPDFKKDRTNGSEEVAGEIEDALDDLGYDFDVEIDDGMLPRMNVKMGKVNINRTSRFSDEDIEGLIAHEIKGHVGRRFYGKKTGLWLFAYGTQSSSTYDEGLAVWNSLNRVKKRKQNIMFNIAAKTCISYLMYEMDFCDLFGWLKRHAKGMTDYTAFKTVVRPRRRNKDCSIMSGEPMTTYFQGYRMVDEMDDRMRDDILHYNIGPDQRFDLENIKEFLKVNRLRPLK